MPIETTRGEFELIDEGKGTPLVLIHGFPFASESWRDDATFLASSMRVVAPSMRGFGGTAGTAAALSALSIDTMADDVAAVLDALGLEQPVIIGGLSMGGYVSLAFARRHPRRVRALVLADTRAEPDGIEARANRDKAIARVEAGDRAGFVEDLFAMILAPSTRAERPEIVARVRAMALRAEPPAIVAALRALRDRPDARPALGAITVPTLVVVGEHDALTPPAVSHALASAIAGASVRVLSKAGHLSNLEQPSAFRDVVAAFVAAV